MTPAAPPPRPPGHGLVLVWLALVALVAACMPGEDVDERLEGDERSPEDRARVALEHFLDTYVDEDGRVVRRDQGGDTVSEGQAYGLLAAVALEDEERFTRIWEWTQANLLRADGLMAFLWADGEVVDEQAATDADLDAARAMLQAAERFGDRRWREVGLELGEAMLAQTVKQAGGRRILMPGPWAVEGAPFVNVSYFSPRAYDALGEAGQQEWEEIATSSHQLIAVLLDGGPRLTPDWSILDGATIVPAARPGDEGDPAYFGLDAARVPVRYAVSCEAEDVELAAAHWPALSELAPQDLALRLDLGGRPASDDRHPLMLVAAAAAGRAAGAEERTAELLDAAEAMDIDRPTYYGAAWVALGRAKLTTDLLGSC